MTRAALPCFGLAALLALLAAVWLLPERRATVDSGVRPVHVAVLDVSASERRRRPDWDRWARRVLREEAEAALIAGARLAVVRVAADVEVVGGSREPADWLARLDGRGGPAWVPAASSVQDAASELAEALDLVRGLEPARVVLFSTGGATGADPADAWARLAAAGSALEHVEPPPATWPDLALAALELPRGLESDAPAAARLSLELWRGTRVPERAVARLYVRQSGVEIPIVVELELPALGASGSDPERWEQLVPLGRVGFGPLEVEAEVRLFVAGQSGDPVPENDGAVARTYVEGERAVALVRRASDADHAERWLAPGSTAVPGFAVRALRPAELAPVLEDFDLVVTYDIAPARLPQELFLPWLERGGGWFATLGSRAFFGAEADSRLARVLPLERLAPEHPERDVVLLVDGSGSMAGTAFEMVRSAAVDLAESALPSDAVELRLFTQVLEGPTLVKERGATGDVGAEAARRLLAARVPGRSTDIAKALLDLGRERELSERPALVLLLTDGHERGEHADPEAWQANVRASFAASDTRLVAIAVGDEPDADYLAGFLPRGEDVLFAHGLEGLRRIFEYKIADERLRVAEPPVDVLPVAAQPGSLAEAMAVDPERLAPLSRLWRMRAQSDAAEVAWTTADGDSVLGLRRFGLGRVAQFASHPRAGWGGDYDVRAAFGPLLRWLARRPRAVERPRLVWSAERLELLDVDGLPALFEAELARVDGPALERLTFQRALDPAGVARNSYVTEPGSNPARVFGDDHFVVRLPAPVGPLALPPRRAPEFAGERPFRGAPAEAQPAPSRVPLARDAGPIFALAAASVAAVGLFLATSRAKEQIPKRASIGGQASARPGR
ncbi:MAG: vWA domain-containing protein [Planctomycetota bacterium]